LFFPYIISGHGQLRSIAYRMPLAQAIHKVLGDAVVRRRLEALVLFLELLHLCQELGAVAAWAGSRWRLALASWEDWIIIVEQGEVGISTCKVPIINIENTMLKGK
jgi:hypothetical protein